MKAIKTTLGNSGIALYLKGLIAGTAGGSAIISILLCIFALILLISGKLPREYLPMAGIGICSAGAFVSGYITSRIIKFKGLIFGMLSGGVIFLIVTVAGLAGTDETLSYLTLIRLAAFIILGGLGGVKGVNKKDKIRIK